MYGRKSLILASLAATVAMSAPAAAHSPQTAGGGMMGQGQMNQGQMNQGQMNQGQMNQGQMNQGMMNQGASPPYQGMQGYGQNMPGYGMQGYGQQMPGYGMHGYGQQMPGYGMQGYGMMGQGPMGMMGQGQMGMMGFGPGVMPLARDLSVEDVKHMLGHRLAWHSGKGFSLGTVEQRDDDVIVAEIVDNDGKVVRRLEIDRHTGSMHAAPIY